MALLSRYDLNALRPPAVLTRETDWQAPPTEALEAWALLKAWCFEDAGFAGHGPRRVQPLSAAILSGGEAATRKTLAEALCQDLDGSVSMAACAGAAARLVLRLRVKYQECQPWRAPQSGDPWDSGYAREDAQGVAALARFTPRRPTLIVAPAPPSDTLADCLRELLPRSRHWQRPVRMLLVQTGSSAVAVGVPESMPLTSIELGDGANR